MIFKNENIITTDCKIIVHGCNAQGKMGSGVALAIRNRFPKAYKAYMHEHSTKGLEVGTNIIVEEDDKVIVNAITQEFYGYDNKQYVSYKAVNECLKRLDLYLSRSEYSEDKIAMPRIGCGLGGGDWSEIKPIIERYLKNYQVEIYDWP